MALFAELNEQNIVTQVLVTNDNFPNRGHDWLIENLGGRWIETDQDGSMRGKFAAIGDRYDEALDQFIPPTTEETEVN